MKRVSLTAAIFLLAICSHAQQQLFNLPALLASNRIEVVNRNAQVQTINQKEGVHLTEMPGSGIAWLRNVSFSEGTISVDIKGKNISQQSFVGIAFHGLSDSTYDAVYFRPFNFRAPDAVRRSHSVQYISLPAYDWEKLRNEHPNMYEQAIDSAPDPNDWFHVTIRVKSDSISVYINNAEKPSLEVKPLTRRRSGMLGLWVGNNSAGDWCNLEISR
ncbi:hypothetical protein [Deminuibacter soli]|uniref:DUF1080 domain-containing protein n=1 Tax=Deminuibacter soli TaxID=2291815 RepID=A0A3E1NJR7_9BACT|nr:hypothetical protein [Deminuibacter soli]RFM28121.1 hypothetical protein DXN05_11375 [Deminuibacter soli]